MVVYYGCIYSGYHSMIIIHIDWTWLVKGCIPDRIFYPYPYSSPFFCLHIRKKGMENPRKTHAFTSLDCTCDIHYYPRVTLKTYMAWVRNPNSGPRKI